MGMIVATHKSIVNLYIQPTPLGTTLSGTSSAQKRRREGPTQIYLKDERLTREQPTNASLNLDDPRLCPLEDIPERTALLSG